MVRCYFLYYFYRLLPANTFKKQMLESEQLQFKKQMGEAESRENPTNEVK